MKIKKRPKLNILSLISSITALLLVLNCQSVFQNARDTNYHIYELCFLFIMVESVLLVSKNGISRNNKKNWGLYSLIYLFIIFIYILFSVQFGDLLKFLSRFLVFPFALLHFMSSASDGNKYKLFKYFIDWTAIISVITSLFWFLSSFMGLGPTSEFVWKWSGDVYGLSYYNLYFSSPYQYIDLIPGLAMRRNIGIFTEGPMFMLVLSFALLFAYMFKNTFKINRWKIIAILVAMVTTFSVTGYIVVMAIIASKMINKNKNFQNRIIIAFVALTVGLIAATTVIEMKSSSASYLVRMDDFSTGMKAFLSSPILGIGYENTSTLRSFMSSSRSFNMGFSNTLFSVLAYGGIVLAGIYLFPVCVGLKKSYTRHDKTVFLFCILYLMLYCTVIFYTFFINFIVWGYLIYYSTNRVHLENYKQFVK